MGQGGSRVDLEKLAFEYVREKRGEQRLKDLLSKYGLTAAQKAELFEKRDPFGRTLLLAACLNANVKCVKFLVDEGASVSAQSDNGWTALHYACVGKKEEKATELISILLQACADPLVRDSKSQLPAHVAQFHSKVTILRHLESRTCDYVGTLQIEAVSSLQSGVGAVFGQQARESLLSKYGANWKTRWVVIARVRGSQKMAKYPKIKCPKCLKIQDEIVSDVVHVTCTCGQVLIVPPKQRILLNCLSIYDSCNSPVPDTIYNLDRAQCELKNGDGFSYIEITLNSDTLNYVDPVYATKPKIVENFRKTKKRFAVSRSNMLRIGASDSKSVQLAFNALTRNLRSLPEPNRLRNMNNNNSVGSLRQQIQPGGGGGGGIRYQSRTSSDQTFIDNIPVAVAIDDMDFDDNRSNGSPRPPVPPRTMNDQHIMTKTTSPRPLPEIPEGGWSCQACTFRNHLSAQECVMCETPRGQQAANAGAVAVSSSSSSSSLPSTPSNNNMREIDTESMASSVASGSVSIPTNNESKQLETDIDDSPSAPMESVVEQTTLVAARQASLESQERQLTDKRKHSREDIDAFICPIAAEIMTDPVIACDGHTYERVSIESWFAKGNKTSPLTGLELEHTHLVPNIALRNAIEQYLAQ